MSTRQAQASSDGGQHASTRQAQASSDGGQHASSDGGQAQARRLDTTRSGQNRAIDEPNDRRSSGRCQDIGKAGDAMKLASAGARPRPSRLVSAIAEPRDTHADPACTRRALETTTTSARPVPRLRVTASEGQICSCGRLKRCVDLVSGNDWEQLNSRIVTAAPRAK